MYRQTRVSALGTNLAHIISPSTGISGFAYTNVLEGSGLIIILTLTVQMRHIFDDLMMRFEKVPLFYDNM